MRFKGPLTKALLKEIKDRKQDSADVRALLWEAVRLHALVPRAGHLQWLLGNVAEGKILELLREAKGKDKDRRKKTRPIPSRGWHARTEDAHRQGD